MNKEVEHKYILNINVARIIQAVADLLRVISWL